MSDDADEYYRGFKLAKVTKPQPNPEVAATVKISTHSPTCRLSSNRRAMRDTGKKDREDVGVQQDFEAMVLTACGMRILRCWIETHWDLCFEAKGACFFPVKKEVVNT